jgi:carotenoid 1,2-hydratase
MAVDFASAVPDDGYIWWYVDAMSDDGRHALTVIALVGSVFSPYYAHARRCGRGDPLDHCALNVALYGASGKRWSMTERGRAQLERTALGLRIGPSRVEWDGSALVIRIDEIGVPLPYRLRGCVRLHCEAMNPRDFALDAAGRHRWHPLAPSARAEIDFEHPRMRWSGQGYLDSNRGSEPLERAFVSWDWSRAPMRDHSAALLYDVVPREGPRRGIAVRVSRDGCAKPFEAPPPAGLPSTLWRVPRGTRSDAGSVARVRATLEDTPFYARSMVDAQLLGERVTGMHESLSLTRFDSRWVRTLLPFRMPRRA